MKHDLAIQALEKERDQIYKARNEAMRIAAAPFNDKLKNLEFSLVELKNLDAQIEEPEEQAKEIRSQGAGRKRVDHLAIEFEVYPFEGAIIEKFIYILREAKRVLTMAEIAVIVHQYEPTESLVSIKERFGKHTSKYQDKGFIKAGGANKRNQYYGLPSWFDKEGDVLDEFASKGANRLKSMQTVIEGLKRTLDEKTSGLSGLAEQAATMVKNTIG